MDSKRVHKKIAVVAGTRPNFIKAAPFFARAKEYPEFSLSLIHTGQHYDTNMSDVFFSDMQIPRPDVFLGVEGKEGSARMGSMISLLSKELSRESYDAVVVFGDVDSTLAGALAAKNARRKLIHIEAGLRSNDKRMPEEKNRVITDHLSDLLFTTEPVARKNLLSEGVAEEKIVEVGNIMIESIELFRDVALRAFSVNQLGLQDKNYVVVTLHRTENTDTKEVLERILAVLGTLASRMPLVMPLHPGTEDKIARYGLDQLLRGIHVIEPLGYLAFLNLTLHSRGVITDSGGIQEETTHLGIPCATLRDNTERPITLEKGSNMLFPLATLNADQIEAHLARTDFNVAPIPLWDSDVSRRIFDGMRRI